MLKARIGQGSFANKISESEGGRETIVDRERKILPSCQINNEKGGF